MCIRDRDIPYGLLLGQDQPSLGGRLIDGDHQYRHIVGIQKISNDPFFIFFPLCQGSDPLLQQSDPGQRVSADLHQMAGIFQLLQAFLPVSYTHLSGTVSIKQLDRW